MRQETFAILFLMRKGRPKKNGLAPIFARITTGGLRQEVYTQCDSNPETWNQHKERAMGTNKLAIQVNERLNDFRVKIIDIRTKLLAEGYAEARREGKIVVIDSRDICRRLDGEVVSLPRESAPAALENWARRRGTLAENEAERHQGLEDTDLMLRTVQAEFNRKSMFAA